jgi:hypothetical protein
MFHVVALSKLRWKKMMIGTKIRWRSCMLRKFFLVKACYLDIEDVDSFAGSYPGGL